jgi:Icc-related predicted phosphoesterase
LTRFVLISDTHKQHRKMEHPIPDGDVLIHAGDLTSDRDALRLGVLHDANSWFKALSHRFSLVVFCPGNHDQNFEDTPQLATDILTAGIDNMIVLINKSTRFGRFNIHGIPQTPRHFDWAFNVDRGPLIRRYYDNIPEDTNVLITHGPPCGVMDSYEGAHVGCEELKSYLQAREVVPELHVFGHIHAGYGLIQTANSYVVNAAICDAANKPVNKPIVVDLP